MNDYSMPFQKLELEQIPFDVLETALYDLLRYWKDEKDILFERDEGLPPTITHFRIYIKGANYHVDETRTEFLGYIRMMKLSDIVTQLELQCLVRGEKQKIFTEMIGQMKAHSTTFGIISNAVIEQNKGKGLLKKPKKGRPGRPSYPEDILAWNQVNDMRRPINEVYKKWLDNENVQKRKLIDPKTHFHRFIKRNKMGD